MQPGEGIESEGGHCQERVLWNEAYLGKDPSSAPYQHAPCANRHHPSLCASMVALQPVENEFVTRGVVVREMVWKVLDRVHS